LNLLHVVELRHKGAMQLVATLLACVFCFAALAGAQAMVLAATIIVSLVALIFYERKDRTQFEKDVAEQVTQGLE